MKSMPLNPAAVAEKLGIKISTRAFETSAKILNLPELKIGNKESIDP